MKLFGGLGGIGALWLVIAGLGVGGCEPKAYHVVGAGDIVSEDRVGIDDTFEVRVYGEPELSGTFRTATDGTIDYPLAGRMLVAGLRTGEIQQLLVGKLKDRFLKDPQVIVTVKERNSQKVSVLGQVAKP